jgi:hypothetical protein
MVVLAAVIVILQHNLYDDPHKVRRRLRIISVSDVS